MIPFERTLVLLVRGEDRSTKHIFFPNITILITEIGVAIHDRFGQYCALKVYEKKEHSYVLLLIITRKTIIGLFRPLIGPVSAVLNA